MRTSGGKAAPSSRWPEVLFRVVRPHLSRFCCPSPARLPRPTPPRSTPARCLCSASISASSPLPSVRRSPACAPPSARARRQGLRRREADRYRLSESTLETLLAAEPQALLIVARAGEAGAAGRQLAGRRSACRAMPNALLDFEGWLDAPPPRRSISTTPGPLVDRGEAFNLMLSTLRDRMSRSTAASPGSTIVLKVRDLFGRRLELAELAAKHRQLEEQVASLRALLDAQASMRERAQPEPRPSSRRASGASTGWPRPSPCSTRAEAHPFQSGLCRAAGSSSRNGSPLIRATARSSTAFARRGGCPKRPTIATGRRTGSPAYGSNAPGRGSSGTCPTAARCTSSPTARAPAG